MTKKKFFELLNNLKINGASKIEILSHYGEYEIDIVFNKNNREQGRSIHRINKLDGSRFNHLDNKYQKWLKEWRAENHASNNI